MIETNGLWLVQVGKDKGSYKTRYSFDHMPTAYRWYDSILIHSGYKKRIVSPSGQVIERFIS